MAKHGHSSKPTQPMAPTQDDILRMEAEHVVRKAIGQTPIFKQEVARVMRTMKAMENDTVKRLSNRRTERPR